MSNHTQDEICKRFWHRIYHIERKELYSYHEINKLVKDIEVIKDQITLSKLLQTVIDKWYSERDTADLQRRVQLMNELRFVFHKPLRDIGEDPLTTVKRKKLKVSNKSIADKIYL